MFPVFLFYQVTPVFASTSFRHNTVDVWETCAYTENKKQGGRICALLTLSGVTQHFQELSILQYRILCVLWDTDSFATVERRGRLVAQTSTQDCRNLLPIYTLLFSEYDYI